MPTELRLPDEPTVVLKIGSSSVVDGNGDLNRRAIDALLGEIASGLTKGFKPILVSSGAIAAGRGELGSETDHDDVDELQALAAIGQIRLMATYRELGAARGLGVGQVLLTPQNFQNRTQYLYARATLTR